MSPPRLRPAANRACLVLLLSLRLPLGLVHAQPALASTEPMPGNGWIDPTSYEPASPDSSEEGDAPLGPAPGGYRYPVDFPLPASLKPNVEFWKKIYGEYTTSQMIFHDTENLSALYGYLDFSEIEQRNISEAQKQRLKGQEAAQTERWIQGILRDLSSQGPAAKTLSPDHARIAALFGPSAGSADFYQASHEDRIRGQSGMKDRFQEGIVRAGRVLTGIERIFREEGLPSELSRLPFVESMFVDRARSKVGALGIWQFMPSTGRLYLQINGAVDERLDPLLAARGAARLLADNYRVLGSWPLALTAYNHGRAGMARAVETLGTRDLGTIVEAHRSPTFGFASKNFYAEFMAALGVYEDRAEIFGSLPVDPPGAFDEIPMDAYVPVATVVRNTGIPIESLQTLNPALSALVWQGRLDIPAGYGLRIPAGGRQSFLAGWARIPAAEKHEKQRGPAYGFHRIAKGETLPSIARQYGTSAEALRRLNGFKSARTRLRVGGTLRVPFLGGQATVRAPAPSGKSEKAGSAASSPAGAGRYTVQAGDTPAEIAKRFGMTAAALMSSNGIRNSRSLRPGQTLKVAASTGAPAQAPPAEPARPPEAKEPPSVRQYVVRAGDSLYEIAEAHGTSVRALQAENRLGRALLIRPGQTLRIPE